MLKKLSPHLDKLKPYFQAALNRSKAVEIDAKFMTYGFLAVCVFLVLVFGFLSIFFAEKPYRVFDAQVIPMPRTVDLKDVASAKGLLSIVLTDIGLNKNTTDVLDKPNMPLFTVAFSPYAQDAVAQLGRLQNRGYELFLGASFETVLAGDDEGPLAISIGFDQAENLDLLERQIGALNEVLQGIVVPPASELVGQKASWTRFAKVLQNKGFIILDTSGYQAATELYLNKTKNGFSTYARPDMTLDGSLGIQTLRTNIRNAATAAMKGKGQIVVIDNATPLAIQTLAKDLDGFASNGVMVVPVSLLMTENIH